jgi:hypothetical protein
MEYAIEFICRIDGKAEELALGFARLVGDGVAGIVAEAEALYRSFDTVPRPDGFRIRDTAGKIIHEFYEREHA